jgi:hypothetical protein
MGEIVFWKASLGKKWGKYANLFDSILARSKYDKNLLWFKKPKSYI